MSAQEPIAEAPTLADMLSPQSWYYVHEGDTHGPVDRATLHEALLVGDLTLDTPVWHPELPDWMTIEAAGILRVADPSRARPVDEFGRPAPLMMRGAALLIDQLLVMVLMLFVIALITETGLSIAPPLPIIWLVLWGVYSVWMEASGLQGTYGKYGLGLFVVDSEGRRITHRQALMRYLVKVAGLIAAPAVFLIGLPMQDFFTATRVRWRPVNLTLPPVKR